jgi:hypothetical protein
LEDIPRDGRYGVGDESGKISNWLREKYSLILMDAGFNIYSPSWHIEIEQYGLSR